MQLYVALSIMGIILGILLIVFGILFRKHITPWLMMFMILCGIFIIFGCFIVAVASSSVITPYQN